MPVNEARHVDERTALVRELITWVKDEPSLNPWVQIDADRRAAQQAAAEAAAAKEARRERLRAIARLKRPKRVGTRPWQGAGYPTKQGWIDAGSPMPPQGVKR
jgi:glycine/D-amino acid oxidase-like deaminating enzyme